MALPFAEQLALLLPPAWYYRRRIAYEKRTGEPELEALDTLIGRGGTAIDVGANHGFYAYALAQIADRVLAFEPNPDCARFAHRTDVRFIKADVEGSEREVLDGACALIARDRLVILLELLSGIHQNPGGYTPAICKSFRYRAVILHRGETIAALPTIVALGKNTTWGTQIETRNVLFLPQ